MNISYNASAIVANNYLNINDKKAATVMERLASGFKINHAKDNASGLAIARRMNAQIEGTGAATSNSNDGISVIDTLDGALTEVHDMLQRMNELSIKAATGTLNYEDRAMIDEEVQQLKSEISRVTRQTSFNGQVLMNGTFANRAYAVDESGKKSEDVEPIYTGDETQSGKYNVNISRTGDSITVTDAGGDGYLTISSASPLETVVNGNLLTIRGDNDFSMVLKLDEDYTGGEVELEVAGFGGMRLQIGPNEGQTLQMNIPDISLDFLGIANTKVIPDSKDNDDTSDADAAIDQIKYAISQLSQVRAHCGAYQNRLEHIVSSLEISEESLSSAYSQIMHSDVATEMTDFTSYQLMVQAGISMVAQANERPQEVLQLLQ